jgi:prepilin-type processing-associated H-X9-DG protein
MAIYLSDNDDNLPSASSGATSWTNGLNPKYIAAWKPFQSPFDKRSPSEDAASAPVSYGLNSNLSLKSVSEIASASSCILLAPVMSNPATLQFGGTGSSPSPLTGPTGGGNTGGTHSGGKQINVLFADTHVTPMSMSDFHSSASNPNSGSTVKDIRWNK